MGGFVGQVPRRWPLHVCAARSGVEDIVREHHIIDSVGQVYCYRPSRSYNRQRIRHDSIAASVRLSRPKNAICRVAVVAESL